MKENENEVGVRDDGGMEEWKEGRHFLDWFSIRIGQGKKTISRCFSKEFEAYRKVIQVQVHIH